MGMGTGLEARGRVQTTISVMSQYTTVVRS